MSNPNIIPAGEFDPNRYYPTPTKLCAAVISRIDMDLDLPFKMRILDPGAGDGVWGEAYRAYDGTCSVVGVELRQQQLNEAYIRWFDETDYLGWEVYNNFDLVIGNPPFNLAEEFIRHSLELLSDGGYLVFLLRSAFKATKKRYLSLFRDIPFIREYQLVERPGFKPNKDGRNSPEHEYSMFVWQKGNYAEIPTLHWISWK